jgi:formylglycine-generating enzyme required for sulfatase activity/energy-coupling factor transporter ATP-binding protein EcfA2
MTDPTVNQSGGVGINGQRIDIGGDVTGRDKIVNVSVILQMKPNEPPPDLAQLRLDYLAHLRRAYHALDFKGIPQLDTFSKELALEDVYVPLVARPDLPSGETWERARRFAGRTFDPDALPDDVGATLVVAPLAVAPVPVRVEEAMHDKSRVVVIGDPGSGKSTLLKHLALCLASEENAPLPILVPLNAFADALSKADRHLQQYLPEYFAGLTKDLAGLEPLFDDAIATGTAVILLDGLDEVQRDRPHLAARVEAFAQEAIEHNNKVVVTSRIVGYRESPLDPKAWALYTLLDFDRAAIEAFAGKWCAAFEKSTKGDTPESQAAAEAERKSLLASLDANPGVANLASNPLLLTILALIKRQGVELPNRRVELYELYLKTLISAWSKARALDKKPVGPPLDYLQTIAVLGPLALWLRQENPTAGLVTEERLIEWLTQFFMGEDWGLRRGEAAIHAREFLDSVHTYSNLLLERGPGRYGFMHLTLEEALAARGLVQLSQLRLEDSLSVMRLHLTDPAWRETILLAVGVWGLVREEPRKAGEVVRAILKMDCEGNANILLAGACLEDVGELGLGRAAANEVIEALLAASRDRALPPAMQRDAGFSLGRAGWQPDDLDAFITIPAGPFVYGFDNEKKVIEQPYQIAKYPVTNLQYRRFMDAHGYDRQEYWSEDGSRWRIGMYDSKAIRQYEKNQLVRRPPEKRGEPFYWSDTKWNNPLAPVVGVSWFEAEAYCNWLAHETGKPMRLPTEEEWERAARHTDGRTYPWGKDFDQNKSNSNDFWHGDYKVASTTIVGQFVTGNSVEGMSDLNGNVWEWQNAWYDTWQVCRVVRGGAWYYDRDLVRGADRNRVIPDYFSYNLGFRVVSPGA